MENEKKLASRAAIGAFGAAIQASLAALGIAFDSSKRYRLKPIYDKQSIAAAAGSKTDFFATGESSERLHPQGIHGCNLNEPGLVPDGVKWYLLGYGISFVDENAGTALTANDIALLNDSGMIEKFEIGKQNVDEEIFISACAMNEGFTPVLLGSAAALDFDMVTNGQPGMGGRGFQLPAFARQIMQGGESFKMTVSHNSAKGALSAAHVLKASLIVVEERTR